MANAEPYISSIAAIVTERAMETYADTISSDGLEKAVMGIATKIATMYPAIALNTNERNLLERTPLRSNTLSMKLHAPGDHETMIKPSAARDKPLPSPEMSSAIPTGIGTEYKYPARVTNIAINTNTPHLPHQPCLIDGQPTVDLPKNTVNTTAPTIAPVAPPNSANTAPM